jgi:hypothetical protein
MTAVEYLVEQLIPKALSVEQYYHIREAKEMEKQQIIDAYRFPNTLVDMSSEQYYNETFKTNRTMKKEEPKQEPCDNCNNDVCCCIIRKQETLEEAALNFAITIQTKEGTVSRLNAIEWFKAGAKEQAKKMYSEEDMAESFVACWKSNVPDGIECKVSFKEWFEKFKKK